MICAEVFSFLFALRDFKIYLEAALEERVPDFKKGFSVAVSEQAVRAHGLLDTLAKIC